MIQATITKHSNGYVVETRTPPRTFEYQDAHDTYVYNGLVEALRCIAGAMGLANDVEVVLVNKEAK